MKKDIKLIAVSELLILATYLISFSFFINAQVAFLSALLVILGSSYAYKRMVNNQVETGNFEEQRDVLETIEDPHELYDDEPINNAPVEELDLKEIVKEERAKIKTFSLSSMKHGVKGSVSIFRLGGYIFLVLGFIALNNNNLLDVSIYLPALLAGIIVGSISSKSFLS